MIKVKYLHRRSRKSKIHYSWDIKKFDRGKNIDLFSELPKHSPMRRTHHWSSYDTTPLREFLKSKIGEDWNDIYSEMLTKIKKNYRGDIENNLKYYVWIPIYDEDFIPRDNVGRMFKEHIFVDMNNILVKKNSQEILSDAKKYARKMKLMKILENNEKNEEEE